MTDVWIEPGEAGRRCGSDEKDIVALCEGGDLPAVNLARDGDAAFWVIRVQPGGLADPLDALFAEWEDALERGDLWGLGL